MKVLNLLGPLTEHNWEGKPVSPSGVAGFLLFLANDPKRRVT